MQKTKSTDIPRMELESFATVNYKTSFLQVQHYPLNAKYFTIENRETYQVVDYISPNRRQFYKIFHMTEGNGLLTVGQCKYEMGPGDIAFLHPDEIMSWKTTTEKTAGHFCLIHPKYFQHNADHVLSLLKNYPHFKASQAVVQLPAMQSAVIHQHFESMLQEERGTNEDKIQAILLYLQMILVEAQRVGKSHIEVKVSESYGYIYKFLALLESAFEVKDQGTGIKLKTAAEFADQLHVHPNYLNALVKEQTGKTIRDHIQERLLYEAKTLLLQTDWDINSISDGLGFSGHAAFTAFFKNKESISPSLFRKNAMGK